jgi:hypothetical protein
VRLATHPLVWDPVIKTVLQVPASVAFCGLGVLALWIGRRRRRTNIFAN